MALNTFIGVTFTAACFAFFYMIVNSKIGDPEVIPLSIFTGLTFLMDFVFSMHKILHAVEGSGWAGEDGGAVAAACVIGFAASCIVLWCDAAKKAREQRKRIEESLEGVLNAENDFINHLKKSGK